MEEQKEKKHAWQKTKEGWYDHVHLSLRQLDAIIWCGVAALVVVVILIVLEALGIFSLFQ